jgi:hypothetical protein
VVIVGALRPGFDHIIFYVLSSSPPSNIHEPTSHGEPDAHGSSKGFQMKEHFRLYDPAVLELIRTPFKVLHMEPDWPIAITNQSGPIESSLSEFANKLYSMLLPRPFNFKLILYILLFTVLVLTGILYHALSLQYRPVDTISGPAPDTRMDDKTTHTCNNTSTLGLVTALEVHEYRYDGLLEVNDNGPHPIYELIARAESAWQDKHKRASKTLPEAVKEYRRRYGRDPPRGFDLWQVTIPRF